MTPDLERHLMAEVGRGRTPREVAPELTELGMRSLKQMWATLDKWCRRDWYDYGVSIDLGWLTTDGAAWHATHGHTGAEGAR